MKYWESPSHDLPEWLKDFTENLVHEEASASSDAPGSISREALHQEPSRKVVSGKQSICTHFPKNRNCEVHKGIKITRAPCGRRTGSQVLRA